MLIVRILGKCVMVKECGRLIAMYLGQRGVDVLVSNVYGNMSPKNKHGRRYISCL